MNIAIAKDSCSYIWETLLALPEETFWTRRAESSFLSSTSCFESSSLDLLHSSKALTLVDYKNRDQYVHTRALDGWMDG